MELPLINEESEQCPAGTDSGSDGSSRSRLCDCVGVVCSCACAVHCAAMPFVIGWLPALGLTWLADEGFHQWMVAICFLLAVVAVLPGYRRHRKLLVPLLALAGVSVLATGAFAVPDDCCQQSLADVHASASPADGVSETSDSATSESGHDACCEHCPDETTAGSGTPVLAASVFGFPLGWLSRLITPAGGLLLVAAHLLNRRCCDCCERPA